MKQKACTNLEIKDKIMPKRPENGMEFTAWETHTLKFYDRVIKFDMRIYTSMAYSRGIRKVYGFSLGIELDFPAPEKEVTKAGAEFYRNTRISICPRSSVKGGSIIDYLEKHDMYILPKEIELTGENFDVFVYPDWFCFSPMTVNILKGSKLKFSLYIK